MSATKKSQRKGGGSRKHGRNKPKCQAYRAAGRRERNRRRRAETRALRIERRRAKRRSEPDVLAELTRLSEELPGGYR